MSSIFNKIAYRHGSLLLRGRATMLLRPGKKGWMIEARVEWALPCLPLGWVGGKAWWFAGCTTKNNWWARAFTERAGMLRRSLFISWKGKDDVFLSTVAVTAWLGVLFFWRYFIWKNRRKSSQTINHDNFSLFYLLLTLWSSLDLEIMCTCCPRLDLPELGICCSVYAANTRFHLHKQHTYRYMQIFVTGSAQQENTFSSGQTYDYASCMRQTTPTYHLGLRRNK
jgi:hypothetical protein